MVKRHDSHVVMGSYNRVKQISQVRRSSSSLSSFVAAARAIVAIRGSSVPYCTVFRRFLCGGGESRGERAAAIGGGRGGGVDGLDRESRRMGRRWLEREEEG